jgi:DNA primase
MSSERPVLDRSGLVSVESYLRADGITWRKSGRSALLQCPFHDDAKPSLLMDLQAGRYRCMACGERGGDLIDFHRQRTGRGFKAAFVELGGRIVDRDWSR